MTTDRSQGASPDSNSGKLSARLSPRLLARVTSAAEDGPYHSRSHLVRTALQLLLAPPGATRNGEPVTAGETAGPDGVHLGSVRERPPRSETNAARGITVDVIDGRGGGADAATHTFVYDMDRANRTVTFRTYAPPARLTHEQASSVGALRELADAVLDARNWHVREPCADDPGSRDGPGDVETLAPGADGRAPRRGIESE